MIDDDIAESAEKTEFSYESLPFKYSLNLCTAKTRLPPCAPVGTVAY
jgi:hypothetical protein